MNARTRLVDLEAHPACADERLTITSRRSELPDVLAPIRRAAPQPITKRRSWRHRFLIAAALVYLTALLTIAGFEMVQHLHDARQAEGSTR